MQIMRDSYIAQLSRKYNVEFAANESPLKMAKKLHAIALLYKDSQDLVFQCLISQLLKMSNTPYWGTAGEPTNNLSCELIETNAQLLSSLAICLPTRANLIINEAGETLLFEALRKNKIDLCILLIKNGANVGQRNKHGKTAFDYFDPNNRIDIDRNIWPEFVRLIAKPEFRQDVHFFHKDSNILSALLLNHHAFIAGCWECEPSPILRAKLMFELANIIYSAFPDLLEVGYKNRNSGSEYKNGMECLKVTFNSQSNRYYIEHGYMIFWAA